MFGSLFLAFALSAQGQIDPDVGDRTRAYQICAENFAGVAAASDETPQTIADAAQTLCSGERDALQEALDGDLFGQGMTNREQRDAMIDDVLADFDEGVAENVVLKVAALRSFAD